MTKFKTLQLFCLLGILVLLSCKQPIETPIGTPKIHAVKRRLLAKLLVRTTDIRTMELWKSVFLM